MILNRLLFIGLVFSIGILNAQTDFRSAYIIENSSDTIYGQIDYRESALTSKVCRFKNADNVITVYSPIDILGYRITDSKYYVSKEVNNKKVFIEYLIKGKVNIYYLLNEKGGQYYMNKEGEQLTEITYEEGVQKIDGKLVMNKSTKHIGLLNYYMQDAPELQSRIQSMSNPDHVSLIELAEDYHNAVCDDEKCIIYEKKATSLKLAITPFIGLSKFYSLDNDHYTNAQEFGGYVYLWLPWANERLCVKSGLSYLNCQERGEFSNAFKFPLQVQYISNGNKLQFLISEGYNIHTDFKELSYTLSLNPGIGYKISDKISIDAIFTSEFTPIALSLFFDDSNIDLISYAILIGLRVKL